MCLADFSSISNSKRELLLSFLLLGLFLKENCFKLSAYFCKISAYFVGNRRTLLKIIKYLLSSLLLTLSVNSFAETRYVSDEVFVYIHSGPSLEYRIIGTLKVGTKVETLKYNQKTKFMQVKASTGKVGWMKLSELQETLPAKNLLPTVQKELDEALLALENISMVNDKKLSEKEVILQQQISQVAELKAETDRLNNDVVDLKSRKLELELWQETKESREKMNWMLDGGGFLLLGLLIGLIIPFLPRRKKRTNNW